MALVLGMKHNDKVRLTLPDGSEMWLKLLYSPCRVPRLVIEAPLDVRILREKAIRRQLAEREEAPGMGAG